MNLLDAKWIIADLGLAGVLGILFTETGLLVGLVFPGDSLLFIAGVAASGTAAALLGGVHLSVAGLFLGAPIATILGSQLVINLDARSLIALIVAISIKHVCNPRKSG